jgi:hypothetical protein
MGRRGVAVRETRRAAMRADTEEVASYIARLIATHKREDLGPAAAAAAMSMIARVERGELTPRDPAEWVKALVDVARLEMGSHTNASVVAHLSGPALAERLRELQRQAGCDQLSDG